MSIWSSLGPVDGQVQGCDVDYQPSGKSHDAVDVATSTTFNDCVRLSVYESGPGFAAEVMLDRENARKLVAYLSRAIEYIDAAYPPLKRR